MVEGPASILDLPPLRGNPFDLRPIEANRAEYLVGRDRLLAVSRAPNFPNSTNATIGGGSWIG